MDEHWNYTLELKIAYCMNTKVELLHDACAQRLTQWRDTIKSIVAEYIGFFVLFALSVTTTPFCHDSCRAIFLTEMDGRLFITFPYILLGILLFFTRPSPLHSYIPRVNSITQKHQDFMDTFHALGMNHITNGYCLITDVTAIENSFSANRDQTASDRD